MILCIGFKGKNNSSSALVNALSGQHYLLTNSFSGLKKDIDQLPIECDAVYLFGADKNLIDSFRIERSAEKEGTRLATKLDSEAISRCFSEAGINNTISETPTQYLCNEAYWYLLEKYHGKAALIHIPTIKNYYSLFEKITFPEHEYESIRNYLNNLGYCYTTRVYKEMGRYKAGNIYMAPWGDLLRIDEVNIYHKVSERPFYNEMSDEEKTEISRYSEDMGLPYEFIKFSGYTFDIKM